MESVLKTASVRLLLAGSVLLSTQLSAAPNARVDNFRLTDHRGESHELYYLSDMKAVVLLTQGNGCDVSRDAAKSLQELRAKYQPQGVEFLMLNSNLSDGRDAIVKEATAAGMQIPILVDETQLIGEALGVTRNGEALVINTKGWKVAYQGAVSASGSNYVADAIDAVLSGGEIKTATSSGGGCAIAMPEKEKRAAHAQISYEKTIAPMLIDKCVACHREGGIGPFAMISYNKVKGFAPMIREVIRTERMPPWHADPHYAAFSNDRSLTNDETKTLVHWLEAGAPRGAGADPLAAMKKEWPEWTLGQPDLVVETPPFTVPATGVIDYQMVKVKNPLDHDVWIRAIDYVPGDRSVLHHIIASAGASEMRGSIALSNYVPGAGPLEIPEDAGILLPKGADFHFQMHYTTSGKPATDSTKFGLYFRKDAPKFAFQNMVFANPMLKIPANTKVHTETSQRTFDRDALIYSLHPHSHFRGRSASFVAYYPDGRQETLLNVPRYDFNWQATYYLSEPKILPKGTKVVYTGSWDNSTQNKANPDPNKEVRWGEQTWQEMLFGVIRYRYLVPDANKAPSPSREPDINQLFEGGPKRSQTSN